MPCLLVVNLCFWGRVWGLLVPLLFLLYRPQALQTYSPSMLRLQSGVLAAWQFTHSRLESLPALLVESEPLSSASVPLTATTAATGVKAMLALGAVVVVGVAAAEAAAVA